MYCRTVCISLVSTRTTLNFPAEYCKSRIFGREKRRRGEDEKPYVPELWIYAVAAMFARHAFSGVEYLKMTLSTSKGAPPSPRCYFAHTMIETLVHTLWELGRSLRYYRTHPGTSHSQPWLRRPPPSLRVFVIIWWASALKQLEGLPRRMGPMLKSVNAAYVELFQDLDSHHESMLPHEVAGVQDFEPLERCAWEQCLCSVFRPLHSLKKCTGCHMVAYCNLRCQRGCVVHRPLLDSSLTIIRDWKDHKSSCKSARGGR